MEDIFFYTNVDLFIHLLVFFYTADCAVFVKSSYLIKQKYLHIYKHSILKTFISLNFVVFKFNNDLLKTCLNLVNPFSSLLFIYCIEVIRSFTGFKLC